MQHATGGGLELRRRVLSAVFACAVAVAVAGCAGSRRPNPVAEHPVAPQRSVAHEASDALFAEDAGAEFPGVFDPLEPINRGVFAGNRLLDCLLLDPLARIYGWAMPELGQDALRGVVDNLNQPVVILNDLLQGEGKRAGTASVRFLLNSTFGIGGIWDPASRVGLDAHDADFGQTLGRVGVGPGPYLVLPLIGPSTARDALGTAVDIALRPDTWFLPFGGHLALASTDGITLRELHGEALTALEQSSVDFYAAVRSAYVAQREALVRGAAERGKAPDSERP